MMMYLPQILDTLALHCIHIKILASPIYRVRGVKGSDCMTKSVSPDWTAVSADHGSCHCGISLYGPRREKTCLRGFANNTGADQPAHPRSLVSTFIICFWKGSYLNLLQVKFQFSS